MFSDVWWLSVVETQNWNKKSESSNKKGVDYESRVRFVWNEK